MLSRLSLSLVLFSLLALTATSAAAQVPQVDLETVVTGIGSATAVTHAGDARVFVATKDGRILILSNDSIRPQPFLDLTARVSTQSERGLLGLAFHPSYAANGRFFVHYTDAAGDSVIARFTVSGDPNVANPGSEAVLLRVDQPFGNHNGGQLAFGPDGHLYIALGDGGSANDPGCRAQDTSNLLGAILRLDVDQGAGSAPFHSIPASNPFVGTQGRDEIWAYGLRNPWRFSFDRANGALFIGDVGQGAQEEIDYQPATGAAGQNGGRNYGWKVMEGTACTGLTGGCEGLAVPACGSAQLTMPVLTYGRGEGCAVIGGHVYRGPSIPTLEGRYVYGDFCSGRLWAARQTGGGFVADVLAPTAPGVTTFGEDAAGEIYVAAGGVLSRLVDASEPEPQAGRLAFTTSQVDVDESAGAATLQVERIDGGDGAVSVDFATRDDSARAGSDYAARSGTLEWPDGDDSPRVVTIPIVDDAVSEGPERFTVELLSPGGGAELGMPSMAAVTIVDDEEAVCIDDDTTLCLVGGRFRVRVAWRTADASGVGRPIELTDAAGYFYFFGPDNPEIVIKVLDACVEPFNRFWVFAAGLTDVEVEIRVTDLESGQTRDYLSPLGQAFEALRDTDAFATCP